MKKLAYHVNPLIAKREEELHLKHMQRRIDNARGTIPKAGAAKGGEQALLRVASATPTPQLHAKQARISWSGVEGVRGHQRTPPRTMRESKHQILTRPFENVSPTFLAARS